MMTGQSQGNTGQHHTHTAGQQYKPPPLIHGIGYTGLGFIGSNQAVMHIQLALDPMAVVGKTLGATGTFCHQISVGHAAAGHNHPCGIQVTVVH